MHIERDELVLRSAALEVTLLPKVGGKVRQILDKRTGDGLLVSPTKTYHQIPFGREWTNYDTSGMDDCFPNIEPGEYPFRFWQGKQLFQMGEWVYGEWEVERADIDAVKLKRKGVSFDYQASKTYRLPDADTLEVQYAVESLSDRPLRYLWSAHPLFAVKNQYVIRIPKCDVTFTIFPGEGKIYQWPFYFSTDLSKQWIPRGKNLKIFLNRLNEGQCKLLSSNRTISITFDLNAAPVLGIWFNNFGFPEGGDPFRCIAVEPCTSPSDLLGNLDESAYALLQPHDTNRWWLRIRIE